LNARIRKPKLSLSLWKGKYEWVAYKWNFTDPMIRDLKEFLIKIHCSKSSRWEIDKLSLSLWKGKYEWVAYKWNFIDPMVRDLKEFLIKIHCSKSSRWEIDKIAWDVSTNLFIKHFSKGISTDYRSKMKDLWALDNLIQMTCPENFPLFFVISNKKSWRR